MFGTLLCIQNDGWPKEANEARMMENDGIRAEEKKQQKSIEKQTNDDKKRNQSQKTREKIRSNSKANAIL